MKSTTPGYGRRHVLAGLTGLLALTGCGGGFGFGAAAPPEAMPVRPNGAGAAYRLRPGDRLRLVVFDEPRLTGELEIDAAGNVAVPLAGEVTLAGVGRKAAERRIAEALSPDYLRDPQIRIELLSHRPFYILGQVRRPGAYPYSPGMTVIEAVALAGGFTYRARESRVTIVRGRGQGAGRFDGEPTTALLPGDTVRVGARYF